MPVVSVQAQQAPPSDAEKQASEFRARLNWVENGLQVVSQRLGLQPGREKGSVTQDAEIAKLSETAASARKAIEAKTQELLKADPEGAAIVAQMEDIRNKMGEMQKRLQDLEKGLLPIGQRLGLVVGRGEKGRGEPAPGVSENAEIAALRHAAEAARKAVADRITERIQADPEGAHLLEERRQIQTEMSEFKKRLGEQKAGR
jgi:chromosome segregation ATPase